MKRKAVNGNVVVQEIKEEKRSAGGLILVEKETRGKIRKSTVFIVDEDVEKEANLKKGDTVYHRPGTGYEVDLEGTPYLILKNTDLLLVDLEELA